MLLYAARGVTVVEPVHPELYVRLELSCCSLKDEVDPPDDGGIDRLLACVEREGESVMAVSEQVAAAHL